MAKFLCGFPLLFMVCSAFAQTPAADAPVEQINVIPVVIFFVLFVGACVSYFVYLWWNERKKGQQGKKKTPPG
jgi:hypothetical protein